MQPQVKRELMLKVLEAIRHVVTRQEFNRITVKKTGSYQGGATATVVDLAFDGDDNYMALDDRRVLNLANTKDRLRLAMKLVDEVTSTVLKV